MGLCMSKEIIERIAGGVAIVGGGTLGFFGNKKRKDGKDALLNMEHVDSLKTEEDSKNENLSEVEELVIKAAKAQKLKGVVMMVTGGALVAGGVGSIAYSFMGDTVKEVINEVASGTTEAAINAAKDIGVEAPDVIEL